LKDSLLVSLSWGILLLLQPGSSVAQPNQICRIIILNGVGTSCQAINMIGQGIITSLQNSPLPPGSLMLSRHPTVWEIYKWYIVAGISLIVLETLLIGGLFWQRARRKKAESELVAAFERAQESEQRFRLVANTAPVMIWVAGPDRLCTYFNQPWLEFTGRPLESELGNGWMENIHPEDLPAFLDTYKQSFDRREPFTMQYRLRRRGGDYRWILDIGVPRFSSDDSFAGYIGSCIDITDRKLAEEALSGVSRRLIEAQEQERTRIARELHDDINQRIALLSVDLDTFEQRLPNFGESKVSVHKMRANLMEIGNEIQALSHRLHSSKLEYLGLVPACRSFCREIAERQKVTVDFSVEGISQGVPWEISLCIFRVLQESLTNAIKHSGVDHFEVLLRRTSNEIQLKVRDYGIGFDGNMALSSQGLGLVSMRERVNLVKGTMLIASNPMRGTEVNVRIPLAASRTGPITSGAA
jgi:PAS domain S-box-containing protein